MSDALVQLEANLAQARDLMGLALAIDAQTSGALDTTDLLRASLVASVSALDHFVHEVVRTQMIETANGHRAPTDAFRRFPTSATAAMSAASGTPADQWMDEEVRRAHGHLSFQTPKTIAEVLKLVHQRPWPAVAAHLGLDQKSLRLRLQLVVDRRNRIVHEADLDPTPPHDRWPIVVADVDEALTLLLEIGTAIDHLA